MNSVPLHSVSVAGVAFDDRGRILVIRRRDNGQWQAPGGVLETTETFEDGVVREVLEETGVRVRVERLTGVYKNMSIGVVALVYRCRAVSGEPRPSSEAAEVRWLCVDEATSHMTEAFAIRVLDALGEASAPKSRAHNGISLL